MSSASPYLGLSSVGVARFTTAGDLIEGNDAFLRLAGRSRSAGAFLQPTFGEMLGREGPVLHEGGATLVGPDERGRSVRARVTREPDGILALLEGTPGEDERLALEVLALNEELGELQREQARTIATLRRTETQLREALAAVKTLRGLLPLCAGCKKIKTDEGTWERLEAYVERHTEAQVTHGLCQDCLARSLAELDADERGSGTLK